VAVEEFPDWVDLIAFGVLFVQGAFWQLGDICRNAPHLIFVKQLCSRFAGPVVTSWTTLARPFLARPRLTDSFLLFAESEKSSSPLRRASRRLSRLNVGAFHLIREGPNRAVDSQCRIRSAFDNHPKSREESWVVKGSRLATSFLKNGRGGLRSPACPAIRPFRFL
jgi:hypothetical protein